MTDSLTHGWSDGCGVWMDDFIALGHRRLAIQDLSDLGRQPMVSASGRYVMVFNGEIYNFQDLRSDLEKAGYVFN